MMDSFQETEATVKRLAAAAFTEHVAEQRGDKEWFCHKPRTGIYGFHVIIRPGAVVVYGDIGEAIFRGGEAGDTHGWLARAVESPGYLMSKIRPVQRRFYPDDAVRYAQERAGEAPRWEKVHAEAKAMHKVGSLYEGSWGELVLAHTGDSEACSVGQNHPPDALWIVEGLRWLVRHAPEAAA
jgi:hypothetical protein